MRFKRFTTENKTITANGRKISLLILKPTERKNINNTACVLWMHGGGYRSGFKELALLSRARDLVSYHGAVVVCPGYTLSYKMPFPAALEDCYASLIWMKENASKLGASDAKLMVGGESAGGGLTAALCMMAHDKGEVDIACQLPISPMLDSRDTESSRNNKAPVWNTKKNHAAWKKYLRGPSEMPPEYASPALRKDFSGLPPAYTFVCDGEPFYAEAIEYISRLTDAGVDARIDVFHAGYHSFDLLTPWREVSHAAIGNFNEFFEFALENYSSQN